MQPTDIVYGSEVNSSDAFVPPKPNEFDKTALIGIFFEAVKGMKASLNMISGLVRLSVNGATPWCMAKTAKIASTAPAAPRRWPIAPFVEDRAKAPDVACSENTFLIALASIASPE